MGDILRAGPGSVRQGEQRRDESAAARALGRRRGVMGGLLAASILQGAPFVMLFFAAGLYGDSASSGNAMLVMTAITGLGLLFAHIVLIIKVRGLGLQIEKQVPYAQVPYS